jgi:hypothetical protein
LDDSAPKKIGVFRELWEFGAELTQFGAEIHPSISIVSALTLQVSAPKWGAINVEWTYKSGKWYI